MGRDLALQAMARAGQGDQTARRRHDEVQPFVVWLARDRRELLTGMKDPDTQRGRMRVQNAVVIRASLPQALTARIKAQTRHDKHVDRGQRYRRCIGMWFTQAKRRCNKLGFVGDDYEVKLGWFFAANAGVTGANPAGAQALTKRCGIQLMSDGGIDRSGANLGPVDRLFQHIGHLLAKLPGLRATTRRRAGLATGAKLDTQRLLLHPDDRERICA